MTRIGIVGGGPGGLFAAQLLEEFCADLCTATIFEAGPRVGGKVLTRQFDTAPVLYEAGVAELYDYSHFGPDPIRQLIAKLGLDTVPMDGPAVVLGDKIIRNYADMKQHFGAKSERTLRAFHKKCRELCTPANYYEGHWQDDNGHPWSDKTFRQVLDEIPDEMARKYIEVASRSDVATEPHLTSALNGLKNVLMDDPRYLRLYSIVGGIQKLVDGVAAKLKTPIHLNSPVVRIAMNADQAYRLTTRHDGAYQDHDFDFVIVALPDYWMQRIEWGSRELRLAMQAHVAHYHNPAHYLRMSVLFKKPFWRAKVPGAYFMSDAFGGCCVYDEGARHPAEPYGALGWLLAGNDAMALGNLDDERLVQLALDSLPKPLAQGRDLFLEGHVQRWVGSISGLPGGQPTHEIRRRHVPDQNVHPKLYLMGDYLFDSTLNGVYDSADFVTDLIMVLLRKQKYMSQFNYEEVDAEVAVEDRVGKNGVIERAYFDYYYGDISYEQAFSENLCFNLEWTVRMLETVWGKKPPFRLLDSGSACGLTLDLFAKAGIEAWGIENSKYMHAKTPAHLKERNLLGDVCNLPFPDNHFDFVYDTCLAHVPPEKLDQAVRELFRVCKHGVFFSGVTADMTREVIEDYNLFQGVRSLHTLWEWSEIFMKNGFRMAVADNKTLAKIWQIESEIEEDDWYWYADAESMRYCFYSKPAGPPSPSGRGVGGEGLITAPTALRNGQVPRDYFDYYDGNRPYSESWRDCFCEHYTTDLIRAIWGQAPPYKLLDCGSASGLTLEAFAKLGVEAWGVENSEYIHKQTPAHLRARNLLGDVRQLPFPAESFDFVYETCLCHLAPEDLEQAIRELYRVARVGVFFGSFTRDMADAVTEKYDATEGVHSLFTLDEWAQRFKAAGFSVATTDGRRLSRAWKIEVEANAKQNEVPWYPDAQAMRHCFYSKPSVTPQAKNKRRMKWSAAR